MAVNVSQAWSDFNIGFAVLALVFCIIARFIGIFSKLTFLISKSVKCVCDKIVQHVLSIDLKGRNLA